MQLSIITPTKNAGATLQRLIDSIADQIAGREIEHIIVDCLSTDETEKIARDANAIFISQESTIYEAQNIGIDKATGDFIYIIGADDVLAAGAIDEMLSHQNEQVIIGAAYRGNALSAISKHQQTTVYARSIFEKYGKFDLIHPVYADLWFMKKIAESGVPIKFVNKPFAIIAPGGFSSRQRDVMPSPRDIEFFTTRRQ